MNNYEIPKFWLTELSDVEDVLKIVKKGEYSKLCTSAGGRPVYGIFYGKKNDLKRTANLSSALGARDISYYADKSGEDYRPTIFLAGCIHGGEFEGTVALLNLISIFENGVDFMGNAHPELSKSIDKINWMLIPIANPDGRSHVPFKSMVGRSFGELKHYNQGVWKDGTLSSWPECKKYHPILGAVSYLGGYYNDDGINLMHDNFFGDKAAETKAILDITEELAPDFSVLLHSATNNYTHIIRATYSSQESLDKTRRLEENVYEACKENNLNLGLTKLAFDSTSGAFNLISAMHHLCGQPCATYESNQGLIFEKEEENHPANAESLSYEEIYKHHLILFNELYKFVSEK